MRARRGVRQKRTNELISGFARYLARFERDPAFTRSGQLEHHRKTISILRGHQHVGDALADDVYLASLRSTLNSWGIGRRASRLADPDRFASELRSRSSVFSELEHIDLADATDDIRERVWGLVNTIDIVDNQARVVALTKTLHHILPDLVPPMDRAYTGAFLNWQIPEFQNRQREIFVSAWSAMQQCARTVPVASYVGTHPWNTSTTKVIDNAIVGYCIENGLETGTSTTRNQAASTTSQGLQQAPTPKRESWRLEDLQVDLRDFEQRLRAAGLKESSISTYVGRSETFLRWLAGEYRPRGPND